MSLFDKVVKEALIHQPHLSSLRIVVEKELLHHDILRIMRDNNLTAHLTFIGGTCLRSCYGGIRLSEDLDFTGGHDFSKEKLASMGRLITESLHDKYNFQVVVGEPVKEGGNVDTWKIKIETRPRSPSLPAQRINIDICAVPSYEKRPVMLLNPYGVDMGTSGLIIQAQSREEIYADKLLAFAFRPNRIKYRDVWDIIWLHNHGFSPRLELLPHKLKDRNHQRDFFLHLFDERLALLKEEPERAEEFKQEMSRFLPAEQISRILDQEQLWSFIICLLEDLSTQLKKDSLKKPLF